jgi:hypothetical protein
VAPSRGKIEKAYSLSRSRAGERAEPERPSRLPRVGDRHAEKAIDPAEGSGEVRRDEGSVHGADDELGVGERQELGARARGAADLETLGERPFEGVARGADVEAVALGGERGEGDDPVTGRPGDLDALEELFAARRQGGPRGARVSRQKDAPPARREQHRWIAGASREVVGGTADAVVLDPGATAVGGPQQLPIPGEPARLRIEEDGTGDDDVGVSRIHVESLHVNALEAPVHGAPRRAAVVRPDGAEASGERVAAKAVGVHRQRAEAQTCERALREGDAPVARGVHAAAGRREHDTACV